MEPISVATIIAIGLAARWVIGAWRRGEGAGGYELASRDAQIQRLREEVDTLNAEVRRLGEAQSFMVRLLSKGEGPSAGQLPPPANEPQSESP